MDREEPVQLLCENKKKAMAKPLYLQFPSGTFRCPKKEVEHFFN